MLLPLGLVSTLAWEVDRVFCWFQGQSQGVYIMRIVLCLRRSNRPIVSLSPAERISVDFSPHRMLGQSVFAATENVNEFDWRLHTSRKLFVLCRRRARSMCENPTIALGRAQWTYILFRGLRLSIFKFLLAQTSGGVSVALKRYPGP